MNTEIKNHRLDVRLIDRTKANLLRARSVLSTTGDLRRPFRHLLILGRRIDFSGNVTLVIVNLVCKKNFNRHEHG